MNELAVKILFIKTLTIGAELAGVSFATGAFSISARTAIETSCRARSHGDLCSSRIRNFSQ